MPSGLDNAVSPAQVALVILQLAQLAYIIR